MIGRMLAKGSDDLTGLNRSAGSQFFDQALAARAWRISGNHPGDLSASLEIAQWSVQSEIGTAFAQMAARLVPADPSLAALVRQQQDLSRVLKGIRSTLTASAGAQDKNLNDRGGSRQEAERTAAQLDQINREIAVRYPGFASFANPTPLALAEVQGLLGPNDAIILWAIGAKEGYVFAVTRDESAWKQLSIDRTTLDKLVPNFALG